MKPRVREALVVEGRYDKNTVSQAVDALIVETGGFGVFSDRERVELIRALARARGVVILTDSDSAGFLIRNRLKSMLAGENVKHAYIPDIPGKERRKAAPSKEGMLGVEGVSGDVILEALRRAGATFEDGDGGGRFGSITKTDLYDLGLTGGQGSAERREELKRRLDLPRHLSANALLDVLNALTTKEELVRILENGPPQ